MLCADVGRDGYGFLMRLADGLAEEELGYESSSEAISGTDGVSHLHFGRSDIALFGSREDIRADGTTGEDEHIQLVTRNEFAADTAGLLRVLGDEFAGNGRFAEKHGSYDIEFLVIDLEHIRPLERFSDYFGGVPGLTEVDVKDLECILRHSVKNRLDGLTAGLGTLRERTKARRLRLMRYVEHFVCQWNIIPCYAEAYLVLRYAFIIQCHLDGAGRLFYDGSDMFELYRVEFVYYLSSEFVISDSGDSTSVESELGDMISEVSGRATEFASFREAVKERLTDTDNIFFHYALILIVK